jgi:hypothetical protein
VDIPTQLEWDSRPLLSGGLEDPVLLYDIKSLQKDKKGSTEEKEVIVSIKFKRIKNKYHGEKLKKKHLIFPYQEIPE